MLDINQAKEKVYIHNSANPYVDITPYELQVGFPIVDYQGFFPQVGEIIIYVVPAAIFKDKEQVVGYTGKSAGASVRIAKGLTVRTGSSGGTPIRGTVRKENIGDLIITNKRILFIGKDDNFEFAVSKISVVKPLSNETFVIQAGRSSKNILVNSDVIVYTMGFVNYAVISFKNGVDIIAEKKQTENEITSEQRGLCDNIRTEILSRPPKKTRKKNTPIGCLTSVLLVVLIFLIILLVGVLGIASIMDNDRTDSKGNIVEVLPYTDTEILYKEGHPLINDNFVMAKDFYADVDKDKVKVISIAKHASIERS